MTTRLRLESVEVRTDGPSLEAQVKLSFNEDLRTGSVRVAASEDAWQRAVAEATLRGISAFAGSGFFFSLDSVAEIRTGRHPIIVVTMLMHDGQREVFFSGTAPITDHAYMAAARAVLHGLNRWLEPLLDREAIPEIARAEREGRAVH
ncbi:MAG: hypothetical protein ACRDFA_09605 [bacterium]